MTDYLAKPTQLLREAYSARGDSLPELLACCEEALPQDLFDELLALNSLARHVGEPFSNPEALADFAFRCGQVYERLTALSQERALARLGFVVSDTLPPEVDLDALVRFAALRDRLLKTIADFTLKFLVVSTVLLAIGLSLGLI